MAYGDDEMARIRRRDDFNRIERLGEENANKAREIERLRDALQRIKDMTDVDNPDSYRCDDREGCLDTVFAVATETLGSPVSEEQEHG